jgi:hypothetical protein
LGENHTVGRTLHPLENADKSNKYPTNCIQPYSKISAKESATSDHKNIKVLAIEDPHTSLLDTVESESCSYESGSSVIIDPNKGSVDTQMNGTWQIVKSKKSHHCEITFYLKIQLTILLKQKLQNTQYCKL